MERKPPYLSLPSRRKRNRPEDDLQRSVCGLLDLYVNMGRLRYFHIPNGGKRSKIEVAIMKGLGVKAGVPYLCGLITNGPTLFFELKAPGKGKSSDAQLEWAAWLNNNGFDCRICDNVEGVHETVKWGLKQARKVAA